MRWSGRPDRQPLTVRRPPSCASSARRLHLVEDASLRSRSGKLPLGVGASVRGSARHRRRAGTAGGSLAGWRCWHPAGTLAPRLCLHGLNNALHPCAVTLRNKCGGIYFNRWRTIFFSSFNRHAERLPSQGPCAAENGYGEQGYYAVLILPLRYREDFFPRLGEFRFCKEKEGMKSRGKSRRAIPPAARPHRGFAGSGTGQLLPSWPSAPRATSQCSAEGKTGCSSAC